MVESHVLSWFYWHVTEVSPLTSEDVFLSFFTTALVQNYRLSSESHTHSFRSEGLQVVPWSVLFYILECT